MLLERKLNIVLDWTIKTGYVIYISLFISFLIVLRELYIQEISSATDLFYFTNEYPFVFLQINMILFAVLTILITYIDHVRITNDLKLKDYITGFLLLCAYLLIVLRIPLIIADSFFADGFNQIIFLGLMLAIFFNITTSEKLCRSSTIIAQRVLLVTFHIMTLYFAPSFGISISILYIFPFLLTRELVQESSNVQNS